MASALKRKRGTVDVKDIPKRTKPFNKTQDSTAGPKILNQVGWDAAFTPPTKTKELVHTNGINGDGIESQRSSNSPEAADFEEFVEEGTRELAEEERLKWQAKQEAKIRRSPYVWKLSESIAGRMIDVDPVFTQDERYLIVANRTTIQVYSTSNSLLTRSIKLAIDHKARPNARIITYCLSPTDADLVWVACSDGAIYCINWTSGVGADQYWGISSTGCIHMTVASMESAGRRRDVVFTTEVKRDGGWRITANELAPPKGPIQTVARTIYSSNQRVNFLKTGKEGAVIVAASGKRVLLGSLRSADYGTVDKIKYEFRVFESSDVISSLDLCVTDRPRHALLAGKASKQYPVVDVVVGDVKGSIFVHNDLLQNIARLQRNTAGESGIQLMPRKLHWHRQAVHTVKWSLDGNYIISGGTETVLVLWQLDTGKQQFLPHMTATIQNVIVSPSGSSYGVQLADNSTMVLSVAELTPTANIAGIQARILEYEDPVDSSVRRVEEDSFQPALFQHTSAVVNPANPSQLLLGVGPTQRVSHNKPLITSIPYLQTFDLGTGHGESRQALARTNITNINIAPNAHQISEPRVVHMQTSFDGTWLATVDEWIPPKRDLDFIGHQGKDLEAERRQRREVFLKFWQWSKENGDWELVTRIDAPHASTDASGAGRILDLAADPSSTRFSTIGDDAVVRIWSLKMRKRDGIPVRWKDGTALRNWNCQHSVSIGKSEFLNENARPPLDACVAFSEDGSVLAAACGKQNDGLLHLLDPELGTVRSSRTGLFEGPILKMEFLGQDLITVSDRIVVYDLVVDDIRCGIQLAPAVTSLSTQQKMEMVHLAVDRRSQTFAVALPATFASHTYGEQSLLNRYSELAVFHQDRLKPVFVESFSTLITTLLPAVGSEGYLVLDSAAEIRTVLRQGTQAVTSLAQSTSALHLDIAEETSGDLLRLAENEEEEEAGDVEVEVEVEGAQSHADALDHDPDENPVVTQQQLSEVFDIGPSFALPPMEDMFYQVAALFGSKVAA